MHYSRPLHFGFLAISFLSKLSQANPIPQDVRVIGPNTANAVCGLSADNASDTWRNSGASNLLDSFIRTRGPLGWANAIGQRRLPDGRLIDSTLDCADLSGSCPAPDDCLTFDPPALFHVRSAMSNCHRMLVAYENQLQSGVISQILGLSALVQDFGDPQQPESKILPILGGAFSIAAGLSGAVAPVSGAFGLIADILGIIDDAQPENSPIDVRPELERLLQQVFDQMRGDIAQLTKTIFGGEANTSILSRRMPRANNGEETDVGKFFANGRFLIPARVSLDGEVKELVDTAMKRLKQALVIRAIKARGGFVWVDLFLDTPNQCGAVGSRFFDGKCYRLVFPTNSGNGFEVISAEEVLKFDNPANGYNIDLAEMYRNAEDCTHNNPQMNQEIQTNGFVLDGSLPKCFFNLIVVRGRQSPLFCEAVPGPDVSMGRACFNQPPVRELSS